MKSKKFIIMSYEVYDFHFISMEQSYLFLVTKYISFNLSWVIITYMGLKNARIGKCHLQTLE